MDMGDYIIPNDFVMLLSKQGFRVFNEYDLDTTLANQKSALRSKIERDWENRDKQSDLADYVEKIVAQEKLNPLEFQVDNLTVTVGQQMIPAEYFPHDFWVDAGKSYPKEVVTFHLPFTGDATLLRCVPSSRILWTEDVAIEGNEILFEFINFNDNAEKIKQEKDRVVEFLLKQSSNVNQQINQYNVGLADFVSATVQAVMTKKDKVSDLLAKLGTPVKTEQPAQTFVSDISVAPTSKIESRKPKTFDVFICHAHEDKDFVNKLATAIKEAGIEVWYDDFQLGWGDDLRPAIDSGLKNSRFGIVVFSKAFLARKKWTEYELNGLLAKESRGKKVILPVWHNIERSDVAEYAGTFADRFAQSSESIPAMVKELKDLLGED